MINLGVSLFDRAGEVLMRKIRAGKFKKKSVWWEYKNMKLSTVMELMKSDFQSKVENGKLYVKMPFSFNDVLNEAIKARRELSKVKDGNIEDYIRTKEEKRRERYLNTGE